MPAPIVHAARVVALAACLCIAACGERPAAQAPPAAVPDEAPIADAPRPPPAAGNGAVSVDKDTPGPWRFPTDDGRIGNTVGKRVPGSGLVADGRAGWLVFGPYLHLEAGHYEARYEGSVDAGHAGPLHLDIARDKGATVITAVDLAPAALADPAAGGALAVLPFELATPVDDIEVRVRVEAGSRVTVSGIEIRRKP